MHPCFHCWNWSRKKVHSTKTQIEMKTKHCEYLFSLRLSNWWLFIVHFENLQNEFLLCLHWILRVLFCFLLVFDLSNPQAKFFFHLYLSLVRSVWQRFFSFLFFHYFHANWTHSQRNSCIYLQIECTDNSMHKIVWPSLVQHKHTYTYVHTKRISQFIWLSWSTVQWPLLSNAPLCPNVSLILLLERYFVSMYPSTK